MGCSKSSSKREIYSNKIYLKKQEKSQVNNTLLNNQEITEELKEENKNYLETNDNENMTIQNLWDAAKAVLRGKFIAIHSYLKKQEKSQIDKPLARWIKKERRLK